MSAPASNCFPTTEAEVAAVRRFLSLLESEHGMLVKGQVDQLADVVREKSELAAQLAALASRRSEALEAAALTADRSGIAAWFAAHPAETRARDLWSSLLSLAGQARELNRQNGELIQIRLQDNALALEALLGANASLNLYGPDGQSAPSSGRRISDSA
ncbi:flagellar protein FlgN [Accumulibacter sp.]|uniref:flagella synthesis protein FlgN n=1 Tax=Accumulibacter sp. TaxID=2053492 RepID=UPI00262E4555|nr:flagellar protein FlgN [Accumulibacter sp.]